MLGEIIVIAIIVTGKLGIVSQKGHWLHNFFFRHLLFNNELNNFFLECEEDNINSYAEKNNEVERTKFDKWTIYKRAIYKAKR